jgi:uncharacterized protein involved in outer membrane biogenesis
MIKTKNRFLRIAKKIFFTFLVLTALTLIGAFAVTLYFDQNKAKILAQINQQIDQNIQGDFQIGDIRHQFLVGFPNVTLVLNSVAIKDPAWKIHKRTFLKAKEIEIRLNPWSLLKDNVEIRKIVINEAVIDIYKDKNGLGNSNIFKPESRKPKSKTQKQVVIDEVIMNKVTFISENVQNHKLFHFEVVSLKSKIANTEGSLKSTISLTVLAKSMVFNTKRGSFIKNKILKGILNVDFIKTQDHISCSFEDLKIGKDPFAISGNFNLGKKNVFYNLDISTTILWKNASNLLSNNIRSKLNLFNLNAPIEANCKIKGDMNAQGDPEITVMARIKKNQLQTPDGLITNCFFNGKYTNNYVDGKGHTDTNSAIELTSFSGDYNTIPFFISEAKILNFDNPIGTGKFNSAFEVIKLNKIVNKNFLLFSGGKAKINLDFVVDIVDYKINKPFFRGDVNVDNATVRYTPKNITFQDTDIQLHFTEKDLLVQKIKFKNQFNSVFTECTIANFLNLYYDAPEKMVVDWKIYAPYIDLKHLLSALTNTKKKSTKPKKSSVSDNLHEAFDKCKVTLELKADKMKYAKLAATNAKLTLLVNNKKLELKNGSVQSSGGILTFDGDLTPVNQSFYFRSNVKIKDVTIGDFLTSFDNFGIRSFRPNSIRGKLNSTARVSGLINPAGELISKSIQGSAIMQVNNGALVDFSPIRRGWKFAFPFRDLKNIQFSDLSGEFKMKNNKIDIKDLLISSSVLNFNINGIYSFGKGTNLDITLPLRNPKDDIKEKNPTKKAALRNKGIVLYLSVTDDDQNGVKVKVIKNPKNIKI